jgi:hypothetical protein
VEGIRIDGKPRCRQEPEQGGCPYEGVGGHG